MNVIGAIDVQVENMLFSIRTPFFVSVFKAVTLLGDTSIIIVIGTIACIVLWRSTSYRAYAAGLVISVLGAGATAYLLKILIGRARPGGPIPAVVETSSSFPSGHATLSLALYGFIAYLLCKLFPAKTSSIVAAASLIIVGVGFSRLYLGVHFPSDVIAGYLLGGLWLLIGIGSMRICTTVKTSKNV